MKLTNTITINFYELESAGPEGRDSVVEIEGKASIADAIYLSHAFFDIAKKMNESED